jgi:hypothetical protein
MDMIITKPISKSFNIGFKTGYAVIFNQIFEGNYYNIGVIPSSFRLTYFQKVKKQSI